MESGILLICVVWIFVEYARTEKLCNKVEDMCRELEKRSREIEYETCELQKTIRVGVSSSVLEYLDKEGKIR